MNWGTITETKRPLDILDVQCGFQASTPNELTIKEEEIIFILSPGTTDGWVRVRRVSPVDKDPSKEPSGWVPRSCLKRLPPEYRGRALYEYSSENENCITMMQLGQRMDIYARLGEWLLVKLDGPDGKAGGTGYVPKHYVEILDENDP
ncbi:cytoskeletal protein binding protein, partial [Tulasnella sp. 417]